ncbi:sialin-like [Lutzomyia longipalpis]|uniref:sialin-like n=1 Tax=Lutzomyia longipalpis TaxID=7200 RepID=UPI0024844E8C|nr:sialin-like [Lutzomyia longipalpis]
MENERDVNEDVVLWKRKRYLVFILTCVGFVNISLMRSYLAVTIVDMTAIKSVSLENGTIAQVQEYGWSSQVQGLILSAFSYGYLVTQLTGGILCTKFGGTYVLVVGIAFTGLLTILTPYVAAEDYTWIIVLRTLQGLMDGPCYPALLALVTRWVPIQERTSMISLALFGLMLGSVITLPITGAITVTFGWQSASHILGACGLIWAVLYGIMVKAGPEVDSHCSEKEKKFILQNLKGVSVGKKYKIPWKGILTSPAVWSIGIVCFAQMLGSSIFLSQLPRFFTDIMKLNIDDASYLSAIPFIFLCVTMLFSGIVVDMVIRKKILGVRQTRRYFTLFAFFLEGSFVVAASQSTDKISFITYLTIGVMWEPLAISCATVNVVDLCPVSAPIILSMTATLSGSAGIIAPILVGYLTAGKTLEEWQIVFYIVAFFYFLSSIIYCICSKAGIQEWSPVKKEHEGTNETVA